jgi:hypothetical protein
MAHAGGRPKVIGKNGLIAEQWLKNYLSGGPRAVNEIFAVGRQQGFAKDTVKRAKAEIHTIIGAKATDGWWWKDSTVPEPEQTKAADKIEAAFARIEDKLKNVERLTQVPRVVTEHGVIAAGTDRDGFKTASPGSVSKATVLPLQVIGRIKQLVKAGLEHNQIVQDIFEWAYPAAGVSESTLADILRKNGVIVAPKAEV